MAKFGTKLNKIRTNLNLTQTEIAEILGVKPPRVSEWERSVRTPKPLTQDGIFARLAEVEPAVKKAKVKKKTKKKKPRKLKSKKKKKTKKAPKKTVRSKANGLTKKEQLARLKEAAKRL